MVFRIYCCIVLIRPRVVKTRLITPSFAMDYVWYQFRLQLEAAALYDRAGPAVVRRLFEAFRLDDAALARRLDADVDPGLAAFSLAF